MSANTHAYTYAYVHVYTQKRLWSAADARPEPGVRTRTSAELLDEEHEMPHVDDDSGDEYKPPPGESDSDGSIESNFGASRTPRKKGKRGKEPKKRGKELQRSGLPKKPEIGVSSRKGPYVLPRSMQLRANGTEPVYNVWNAVVDDQHYLRLIWYDHERKRATQSDFFVVGYLPCVDYEYASNLALLLARQRGDAYPNAPPVTFNTDRDPGIQFIVRHNDYNWTKVVPMNWWLLFEELIGPDSPENCRFFNETTDAMHPTKSFRNKCTQGHVDECNAFGRKHCRDFMTGMFQYVLNFRLRVRRTRI
jgi:hypothetical protein